MAPHKPRANPARRRLAPSDGGSRGVRRVPGATGTRLARGVDGSTGSTPPGAASFRGVWARGRAGRGLSGCRRLDSRPGTRLALRGWRGAVHDAREAASDGGQNTRARVGRGASGCVLARAEHGGRRRVARLLRGCRRLDIRKRRARSEQNGRTAPEQARHAHRPRRTGALGVWGVLLFRVLAHAGARVRFARSGCPGAFAFSAQGRTEHGWGCRWGSGLLRCSTAALRPRLRSCAHRRKRS